MIKKFLILVLVSFVIALPFAFRERNNINLESQVDERLVVITAHNEAIRREYAAAFAQWYQERTGKSVRVEWRVPGGTSEAVKYIDSTYLNAFRLYWEKVLKKKWSKTIQYAFSNPKIVLPEDPREDSVVQSARRAFLQADINCGVDVCFGGGVYEFSKQAEMGHLMALDLQKSPPAWFVQASIPYLLGGDELWDKNGRWIGAGLSSFGIVFNRDVLKRIGFTKEPQAWSDLTDPCFVGSLALVDPTLSSPTSKTFEMIVQQQMHRAYEALEAEAGLTADQKVQQAIEEGWLASLRILQKMAANTRYFMESSAKAVLDVAAGSCAVGMAIDHYGRYQQENTYQRSGSKRFGFTIPQGQVSVTPDTIAILKGAPNKPIALAFVEFVISLKGQKLLGLRAGAPDGPQQFTLRCMPITQEFYEDAALQPYRADPGLNPYEEALNFFYHKEWTTPIVGALRFIIKAAFIDAHTELVEAWKAILEARRQGRTQQAELALGIMQAFSEVDYPKAAHVIGAELRKGDPLTELSLQAHLTKHFRKQYMDAYRAAKTR